jgi:hypothetical protein
MSVVAHNQLKRPMVLAMFNSAPLIALLPNDSLGNKSIYEGWHKPEGIQVEYPYITYRINWYPTLPTGFLNGTMLIDVWDAVPGSNDARPTEAICTILAMLFTETILMDGLAVVRCKITADEWIQDDEPGRIHRQLTVELHTIDVFSE